ncbi:MAG: transposase-like protein [Planctomycetota bacterium]|jgi:transposase-like protein
MTVIAETSELPGIRVEGFETFSQSRATMEHFASPVKTEVIPTSIGGPLSISAPPFCPRPDGRNHKSPQPRFFVYFGTYPAKCRAHRVQRYQCKTCRSTFSRQTFRTDYRDHKPHLNSLLFRLVSSGVGTRQCTRFINIFLRCTDFKLGRHARHRIQSLIEPLTGTVSFHLDEIEADEGRRNARPWSVPILLLSHSRYIIWAELAPIHPRGKMTEKRLQAIARSEGRHGHRLDQSRASLVRTFLYGEAIAKRADNIVLSTDEKSSYGGLATKAFGKRRLDHRKTDSKLMRDTRNPLFAINHEEAVIRDLMGRLRRESWLVSKNRC